MEKDEEFTAAQRTFLADSLKFILKNNYFLYGDDVYWQQKGTTMGTRVAPSFSNLFMGAFEEEHIYKQQSATGEVLDL